MNIENWMRTIALGRAFGNSDTYGYQASHNMYAYQRPGGLWELVTYDFETPQFANKLVTVGILGKLSGPQQLIVLERFPAILR